MISHPIARILVAVDFGSASARAVQLAGHLAARAGAALAAVHAETIEVPPYFTRDQLDALEAQVQAARQRAAEEVRRFVGEHTATPAAVVVSDGPAVDAILAAAAGTDLVVVGTHGRRGPARWWLGSVAERVVREATMPVLVVHGPEEAGGDGPVDGPVLLAAGAASGDGARQWARALGELLGAEVTEGPDVAGCAAHLPAASLVVVPVPPREGHRVVHEAAVALAHTCRRPVLFVPDRA